jgi:hypothetical protein
VTGVASTLSKSGEEGSPPHIADSGKVVTRMITTGLNFNKALTLHTMSSILTAVTAVRMVHPKSFPQQTSEKLTLVSYTLRSGGD